MTTHFQNFDSLAAGAPASSLAGWANLLGTSVVANTSQFSSAPNAVAATINGDMVGYTGDGIGGDQSIKVKVFLTTSGVQARAVLRSDAAGLNYYECFVAGNAKAFTIRRRIAGVDQTGFTVTGTSATTLTAGVWFYLEFQVSGNAPATLQARLYPIAASPPGWEGTATDTSGTLPSGYPGIKGITTGSPAAPATFFDDVTITFGVQAQGVTFSNFALTSLTVSTLSAVGGTGPYTYQFQRAPDASGTPGTFANIGTSGASLSFNDTGLTLATNVYWYRVVATDSVSGTAIGPASFIGGPVNSGLSTLVSAGNTTASVASTTPTGGVGPIANQWYKGSDPLAVTTLIPGATSLTLNDTGLSNGTVAYYQLHSTDGNSTALGNIVAASPARTVYVGLIGHSWNTTTTSATPGSGGIVSSAAAGNILQQKLAAMYTDGTNVVLVNAGVGGTTSAAWAPGGGTMNAAIAAFNAAHPVPADWLIHCQLDINDSATTAGPVPAATFQANMQTIVNYLLSTWGAGKIVLEEPPYISAFSTAHTALGVSLMTQYAVALRAVAGVDRNRVFNTYGTFSYYVNHQSDLGADQVHPTPADGNGQGGATNLAARWARNIFAALGAGLIARSFGVGGQWK